MLPDPEDLKDVLRTIELYEDDKVCDSAIIVVETGLDRGTVDQVLDYLWQEDRIECRPMPVDGEAAMLTGIRRVLAGRPRRWGEWGHYQKPGIQGHEAHRERVVPPSGTAAGRADLP